MELKSGEFRFWTSFFLVLLMAATLLDASAETYSNYIVQADESRQSVELRNEISQQLRRPLEIRHNYTRVFTGFSLPMSAAEAEAVRGLSGIQRVVIDEDLFLVNNDSTVTSNSTNAKFDSSSRSSELNSSGDPVVDLMGANQVWDGSATNDGGHLGEGTVIGIIGPGLIVTHPIFDSTDSDGYTHTNPLGEGQYLGDCFETPQDVCNSKLIGRYNFTEAGGQVAPDLESYSAQLLSQSAGNRLTGDSLSPWGVDIVTGVAPHANVIVYRVCPAFSCPASAVLQALEQAIIDGVDVLINPIGGSNQSPWGSIFAPATLSLRENGVMLSQAAGSSGPEPGSLIAAVSTPWSSVFVSSTHAQQISSKTIGEFQGGNPPVPPTLQGGAIGEGVSGPIVYAGNIPNPNSPGDPGQCLQAYPDSMLEGMIVVCDRGQIARVQKAINARDSGAIGFVLGNISGGSDTVSDDIYVIPGIHLNTANADILRSWLSTGTGHQATISESEAVIDFELADHVAITSGRGPILDLDYLMPSGTVPSQNIVTASFPDLFKFVSGTSAATAGGVFALLKSAQPEWTDAERLSALMTTGVAPLTEDDGTTPTGTFTHGGGRVNLPAATRAGLVLDETIEGFMAANPLSGGQTKDLNLAGLINLNCLEMCTWSRTVRATQNGTWSAAAEIGSTIQIDVAPATFTLSEGETQTLVVTLNRSGSSEGGYDGVVTLSSDNSNVSNTAFQLHVGLVADSDLDGLPNDLDNCLNVANVQQQDTDNDSYGNACDADLNNDGVTNFLDLSLFSLVFQSSEPNSDFNSDGTVNFADLDIFKSLYLLPPGPSGIAPSTVD
ncbi:MAG: S8 family serine peptidase [Gammaproteobacteria bacterium]